MHSSDMPRRTIMPRSLAFSGRIAYKYENAAPAHRARRSGWGPLSLAHFLMWRGRANIYGPNLRPSVAPAFPGREAAPPQRPDGLPAMPERIIRYAGDSIVLAPIIAERATTIVRETQLPADPALAERKAESAGDGPIKVTLPAPVMSVNIIRPSMASYSHTGTMTVTRVNAISMVNSIIRANITARMNAFGTKSWRTVHVAGRSVPVRSLDRVEMPGRGTTKLAHGVGKAGALNITPRGGLAIIEGAAPEAGIRQASIGERREVETSVSSTTLYGRRIEMGIPESDTLALRKIPAAPANSAGKAAAHAANPVMPELFNAPAGAGPAAEEKPHEAKPVAAAPPQPSINMDIIADRVYQLLERKISIERERRGL